MSSNYCFDLPISRFNYNRIELEKGFPSTINFLFDRFRFYLIKLFPVCTVRKALGCMIKFSRIMTSRLSNCLREENVKLDFNFIDKTSFAFRQKDISEI